MPTVEGFTPDVAWTTLYGIIALGLLFLIGYRVYDAIHTILERKRERKQSEKPDFAEEVSRKVIEKLEPRFAKIEENLDKDKSRLDNHESVLAGIKSGQQEVRDGLTAICKFMLIIGTYGDFGDNEKVKDANADLQKFLAERL